MARLKFFGISLIFERHKKGLAILDGYKVGIIWETLKWRRTKKLFRRKINEKKNRATVPAADMEPTIGSE